AVGPDAHAGVAHPRLVAAVVVVDLGEVAVGIADLVQLAPGGVLAALLRPQGVGHADEAFVFVVFAGLAIALGVGGHNGAALVGKGAVVVPTATAAVESHLARHAAQRIMHVADHRARAVGKA